MTLILTILAMKYTREVCKKIADAFVAIRNSSGTDNATSTFAVEYIVLAASHGNHLANGFLAAMYFDGFGVPKKNEERAQELMNDQSLGIIPMLQAACLAGEEHESVPYTQYVFALYLMEGCGIDKDFESTVRYLTIAADAKYPPAMNALASRMQMGDFGLQVDQRRALLLLEAAAEMDYVPSLKLLAKCFVDGVGTEQNSAAFVKTLKHLIRLNDYQSFGILGDLYRLGDHGVARDRVEAVRWYQLGADRGDKDCQRLLSRCYKHSTGVSESSSLANTWLEKAAKQEDEASMLLLAEQLINDGEEINAHRERILSLLNHPAVVASAEHMKS